MKKRLTTESASGIFVLFTSPKHLEAFQNFLNGRHANISFTIADASKYALNKLHAELFQKKPKILRMCPLVIRLKIAIIIRLL